MTSLDAHPTYDRPETVVEADLAVEDIPPARYCVHFGESCHNVTQCKGVDHNTTFCAVILALQCGWEHAPFGRSFTEF
jgi:hypothetical protein